MPETAGKPEKSGSRTKKRKRKMKKDAASTGNPVKAGYIKYDMSGFFASKHPEFDGGETRDFTENVKTKGAINIFCKMQIRRPPGKSWHGICSIDGNNLNNPRSWTV